MFVWHVVLVNRAMSAVYPVSAHYPRSVSFSLRILRSAIPFVISEKTKVNSAAYRKDLLRKAEVFKDESHTRNAVQAVIVAAAGFRHNANSDMVVQVVEGDDLFSS